MSSRMDLLFTTNRKLLSEVGTEQTIYDKSHHNIISESLLILTYFFLRLIIGKFGIRKRQIQFEAACNFISELG